jgi:hypothetical protein
MLLGGALFGDRFFAHADPFEVYSSLAAKLSLWGRRDGRLLIRSPLANLDTVAAKPGPGGCRGGPLRQHRVRLVQDSAPWVQFVQGSSIDSFVLNNLALLAFCVAVGAVLVIATTMTGRG